MNIWEELRQADRDSFRGIKEAVIARGRDLEWRVEKLEAELAAIREGDICPACATEFEAGTFKKCGGTIIKEVQSLRVENKKQGEVVKQARAFKSAFDRGFPNSLDAVYARDKIFDALAVLEES